MDDEHQDHADQMHHLGRADALRGYPFGHALSINGGRPYAARADWQRWCYWWGWTLERACQAARAQERGLG